MTEDGLIPIEAVAAGMMVLAEDPETGEKGLRQVFRTFVRETDELTHVTISDKNGNTETIHCTPEHPFYVEGQGWVGAGSLHKGMEVRFSSGAEGTIKDVLCEELEAPVDVYNFEVEDLHTYYVGDNSVLVHNLCKQELVSGSKQGWNAKVSVGGEVNHKMPHAHIFWKNNKLASVDAEGNLLVGNLDSKGLKFVKDNIAVIAEGIKKLYE